MFQRSKFFALLYSNKIWSRSKPPEASYELLSEEKDSHYDPGRNKEKKEWITPFILGFILAFGSIAIVFLGHQFFSGAWQANPSPDLTTRPVLWEEDPIYSSRPSKETDEAWNSLMPAGRGFVKVPSAWQKLLGPGILLPDHEQAYAISMFHQLHCLAIIRTALYNPDMSEHDHHHRDLIPQPSLVRLKRSKSSGVGERSQDHDFMVNDDHVGHCFDYLRQAIQCAGDMTLESAMPDDPGAVDGWGIEHQCKDWDAAYKWAQENEPGGRHNYSGIL